MNEIDRIVKLLSSEPSFIIPGKNPTICIGDEVIDLREFLTEKSDFSFAHFMVMFVEIARSYGRFTGRAPRGDVKTKKQFSARISEGYSQEDFRKAIISLHKDSWHSVEQNGHPPYYYADAEYITRASNLEKYIQRYVDVDDYASVIIEMKDTYDLLIASDNVQDESRHKESWASLGGRLRDMYIKSPDKQQIISKIHLVFNNHKALPFIMKSLDK